MDLGFTDKLIGVLKEAVGIGYRIVGPKREADWIRITGDAQTAVESGRIISVAQAEAERKLILDTADAEILERARRRKEARAVNRQRNVEAIAEGALNYASMPASEEPLDPDWVTSFFDLAEKVSSPTMQKMWSTILAQEISDPGFYSVKALKTLAGMSQRDARSFVTVCGALSGLYPDYRVNIITGYWSEPSLWRKDISGSIELPRFGLTVPDMLNVENAGLLYPAPHELSLHPKDRKFNLFFQSNHLQLAARFRTKCALRVRLLTPVGLELSRLPAASLNEAYWNELRTLLSKPFRLKDLE